MSDAAAADRGRRFSSGPWTGFYHYEPRNKHRMDLELTFADGHITGDGLDDVGRFLVKGHYDEPARECRWIKTYPGSHDVYYEGFREGKGIWGRWEIGFGLGGHGGFHIWPKGVPDTDAIPATAAESAPADAISVPTLSPIQAAKNCGDTQIGVAQTSAPRRFRSVDSVTSQC